MDLSKETEEAKNNPVRKSIVTSIICISFNQDKVSFIIEVLTFRVGWLAEPQQASESMTQRQ